MKKFLSLVIPAYNEEKRIGSTLARIYAYLQQKGISYEVIVVDDGSVDSTASVARQSDLARAGKLKVVHNPTRRGKGYSVKAGILNTDGDFVLFSDADLSTPIEELESFLPLAQSGYDMVIGSRSLKGARIIVHQPFYREYMGKAFNWLVQAFVLRGFIDTQCGFKLFKGDVARQLAALQLLDGFAFDVELIYLAKRRGYTVKEIPVTWVNSAASKVNPVFDSLKMIVELLRIKRIHFADRI